MLIYYPHPFSHLFFISLFWIPDKGEPKMKIAWMDQAPEQWLEKFRFFTPIQVRFSDTDQLGHINNVSYFSYFEYGRIAYLEALDLTKSLLDASRSSAQGVIVTASLECQYLKQVHFGEKVSLGVRISRLGRSSADFEYALVTGENKTLSAAGRGAVVYIDPKTGKSRPIPEEVKDRIRAYEQMMEPIE
jgi:acyl-CoA thioester hydrolase